MGVILSSCSNSVGLEKEKANSKADTLQLEWMASEFLKCNNAPDCTEEILVIQVVNHTSDTVIIAQHPSEDDHCNTEPFYLTFVQDTVTLSPLPHPSFLLWQPILPKEMHEFALTYLPSFHQCSTFRPETDSIRIKKLFTKGRLFYKMPIKKQLPSRSYKLVEIKKSSNYQIHLPKRISE
jgi:hypothetical protein